MMSPALAHNTRSSRDDRTPSSMPPPAQVKKAQSTDTTSKTTSNNEENMHILVNAAFALSPSFTSEGPGERTEL